MKVLQLCKFFPPFKGGMESVVFELSEGLTQHGMHVQVLCANTENHTCVDTTLGGYPVTRAAAWGRWLSTSMSPALLAHTKKMCGEVDLIHVHMPDPMAALALWWAKPRARNTKLVVHWHSDVVRQRLAMQLYQPLQNWLLRRADAVVATSAVYAESSPWLQPWKHKTVVIPIGISPAAAAIHPEEVQQLKQRFNAQHIVLSLGRMTYYKGFEVLIEAAAQLPPGCVIVVGGVGELLQQHRAQVVQRGLSSKIFFIGHIAEQDLATYFAAASVFCLASTQRAEAYGVVLLEAMAMGKPLTTTRIPGSAVSWINQHDVTGLTVPVGNACALAQAIHRITTDLHTAKRFGAAARARFEQHLQAPTMIQHTVNLYRQLMVNRPE
jgi:glycosyltransferase involved in cell wall biosynthesis